MELWLPWQHIAPIDLTWEKSCHHSSSFNFFQITFIRADNEERHLGQVRFWAESGCSLRSYIPLSVRKFAHRLNMGKMLSSR